jgi:selenocysteine lyase/cysteine desulfurase
MHLSSHFIARFGELSGFSLIDDTRTPEQLPIFSLVPEPNGVYIHYLARALSDRYHILTTAGKQCAHPYYEHRGLAEGSIRVSLSIYNSIAEIDRLIHALTDLTITLPTVNQQKRA